MDNNIVEGIIDEAKREKHNFRIFLTDSRSVGIHLGDEEYKYTWKFDENILHLHEYEDITKKKYILDCNCITHIRIMENKEEA